MKVPAILQPASDSLWCEMRRMGMNPRLHLLNLLWSVWVFATLFFAPVHASFWWSVAVSYPLFLLLFVLVHVRPMRELEIYAESMALIAFVSMYWNPAGWTYAVFACAYAGFINDGSILASTLRIVMIEAVLMVWAWWLNWPWPVMLMAAFVCSSTGFGALLGQLSKRKNAQLRLSQDEVRQLAANAERERIGRDLHDLLGHTLSLITLKLELSRRLFDRDHEAARRELEEAEKVARHALSEVRAAVTGIRATDLAAELASARLLLGSSGVNFDAAPLPSGMPAEIERALALVLREAVTNIARHARATQTRVAADIARGRVSLCIEDNGRGGIGAHGNGLSGMRERVQAMGGTLTIDSPRGRGTRLCVDVPLPQPTATTPAPESTHSSVAAARASLRGAA